MWPGCTLPEVTSRGNISESHWVAFSGPGPYLHQMEDTHNPLFWSSLLKRSWRQDRKFYQTCHSHLQVVDRKKSIHCFWTKSKNFKTIYQLCLCFSGTKVKFSKQFKPDLYFPLTNALASMLFFVHFSSVLATKEFKRKDGGQSICVAGYNPGHSSMITYS